MAWRSSGNTNKEMVDNLKRNGLILTSHIEHGFRQVDRTYFVPKGMEEEAHLDQPLKEGNLHISAPHIYSSALEELELERHSSQSFLNVGSGTGYLSCIVAAILGPQSLNYGVEIHKEAVQHSLNSIKQYRIANDDIFSKQTNNHMKIIHGNGLHISTEFGECRHGFDRIYIGAAVSKEDFLHFEKLLALGGILVGPVEDELVKVIRINKSSPFSEEKDFLIEVISDVCFSPLTKFPKIPTNIPICDSYHTLPSSYQKSSLAVFLCSNANYYQHGHSENNKNVSVNLATTLPKDVWIHIFTFTHRKWFEPKDILKSNLEKRILEAKQRKEKEANKCQEADEYEMTISEHNMYRFLLLARRRAWQIPPQLLLLSQELQEDDDMVDSDDDHTHQQNNDDNENGSFQSNNDSGNNNNSNCDDSAMEDDEQDVHDYRLNVSLLHFNSHSHYDNNNHNIHRDNEGSQLQQEQQEEEQMEFDSSTQTFSTTNTTTNGNNDGICISRRTVSMDNEDCS